MFVDYRNGIQQAISSLAAFRPRAHTVASYTPSIKKGRPVLQGLLAIDFLAKEVLGWAQAMPKFSGDLVKYVQTFLERTYERCRTSYMMEAVLEKQSYMLIGRHDIEKLMRFDPANACLPNSLGESNMVNSASDAESLEIESELSELLFNLGPIKQENLIHDDNKLILLASLSDSLEYVADSIESYLVELAPFVAGVKQNYIFGGICSIAASASIKALADMKSINLFGVKQICWNSIALEQALASIPSIDSEAVQQRLDHVRTYYELLNMPFEALLAFITEHEHLFTVAEYTNLLKVKIPGREIPPDAQDRVSYILTH